MGKERFWPWPYIFFGTLSFPSPWSRLAAQSSNSCRPNGEQLPWGGGGGLRRGGTICTVGTPVTWYLSQLVRRITWPGCPCDQHLVQGPHVASGMGREGGSGEESSIGIWFGIRAAPPPGRRRGRPRPLSQLLWRGRGSAEAPWGQDGSVPVGWAAAAAVACGSGVFTGGGGYIVTYSLLGRQRKAPWLDAVSVCYGVIFSRRRPNSWNWNNLTS